MGNSESSSRNARFSSALSAARDEKVLRVVFAWMRLAMLARPVIDGEGNAIAQVVALGEAALGEGWEEAGVGVGAP